jgi:hypothetical protein
MAHTRKSVIQFTCDVCGKKGKLEWDRDEKQTTKAADSPIDGWFIGIRIESEDAYFIQVGSGIKLGDFCGLACLLKGTKKHFEKFEHINK